jgi:hypothetical protein
VLGLHPVQPLGALRRHQERAGLRGECGQPIGRPPPDQRSVAAAVEQLGGQLADRLHGDEPRRAVGSPVHESLVDQGLQRLQEIDVARPRRDDLVQGRHGRSAREDREDGEDPARRLVEQVVAPQQRAAERLLPGR